MKRTLVSSGSVYEKPIGFSRAVRVGRRICVSGTAPIASDGAVSCPGDPYGQTKRCLEIIKIAIIDAGGLLEHVIRTRVFLKDVDMWEDVARAHGEMFGDIRPASTFVQVSRFINPEWLVEIEAECEVDD